MDKRRGFTPLEIRTPNWGSKKFPTGFTLIELLVVIAIIALLMAILMPALQRVKKQARTVVCQAHLHQWSLVWTMYLDDNNGKFANRNDWPFDLRKYYRDGNLRLCPEAKKPYIEGGVQPFASWGPLSHVCEWPEPETSPDNYTSYGCNEWILDLTESWSIPYKSNFWRTRDVKGGAHIPVLMDCSFFSVNPFHSDDPPEYESDVIMGSGVGAGEIKRFCVNRHNGFTNSVFLDWSVRKVGLKELWELKWHRNWNRHNEPPPVWPPWMRNFKDY